jgi:hypothetical protein
MRLVARLLLQLYIKSPLNIPMNGFKRAESPRQILSEGGKETDIVFVGETKMLLSPTQLFLSVMIML